MRSLDEQNELHLRFRRRVVRGVLKLIAVGVLFAAYLLVLEIPFAPWIRSFGLWPTLTGTWHGQLETSNGRTTSVYFDIDGRLDRHGTWISGTARWCDGSGDIRDYRIHGDVDNWSGTRFHISTSEVVTRAAGISLGDLRGERSGDEIRAVGALASFAPTATSSATRDVRIDVAPQSAVRYVLRRGSEDEFLAACTRDFALKEP
jgi:hypothetical protein